MARKSNKTAHVLGLITNTKSASSEDDLSQEIRDSQDIPFNKPFIVEMANTGNDPISELIKNELTKLVEDEYPTDNIPSMEHDYENKISDTVSLTDTKENQNNLLADKEQPDFLEHNYNLSPNITKEENNLPSPESYCCVNIMEDLVKEKLRKMMNKFNVCTCPKCIKDTMAIALNHLQPKYIVTESGELLALVNIYANQFSVNITTEIMKACFIVKENPRH